MAKTNEIGMSMLFQLAYDYFRIEFEKGGVTNFVIVSVRKVTS